MRIYKRVSLKFRLTAIVEGTGKLLPHELSVYHRVLAIGPFVHELLNVTVIVAFVLDIEHVDYRVHGGSTNPVHDVEDSVGPTDSREKTLQLSLIPFGRPLDCMAMKKSQDGVWKWAIPVAIEQFASAHVVEVNRDPMRTFLTAFV